MSLVESEKERLAAIAAESWGLTTLQRVELERMRPSADGDDLRLIDALLASRR